MKSEVKMMWREAVTF